MEEEREYKRLVVWQNAYKLRRMIYDITARFSKIEIRRISQMRDTARSVKQNIQEGYKSGSIGKYIQGVNISKGSLGELMGDIEDCFDDNLINHSEFKLFENLIKRTDYLLFKLLRSLEKMRQKGTWINFVKKR